MVPHTSWSDVMQRLESSQSAMHRFKVDFIDEDGFMGFISELRKPRSREYGKRGRIKHIDITGYFGEPIIKPLTNIIKKDCIVRIITTQPKPEMFKLRDIGVDVKINPDIHARIFVAYDEPGEYRRGRLLLGFDFDFKGMGGGRRDAGIITRNPDLIKSAVEYFDEVWNDKHKSKRLGEK